MRGCPENGLPIRDLTFPAEAAPGLDPGSRQEADLFQSMGSFAQAGMFSQPLTHPVPMSSRQHPQPVQGANGEEAVPGDGGGEVSRGADGAQRPGSLPLPRGR